MADTSWYRFDNENDIPSPALIVYPDQVQENIRRMIAIAGGVTWLRPHVKTHKMAEVIKLQMAAGITKFKVATLAEAEMVASCGAPDVLLAFPQVGPNAARFTHLVKGFPNCHFSTVADDAFLLLHLSAEFATAGLRVEVLLDIDNGMHRTGIAPGPQAFELYRSMVDLPGVKPGGLHVYDGQHRDRDIEVRRANAQKAWIPVQQFIDQLHAANLPVPRIVAGGTPSFPIHSQYHDRECSPGTCTFWDVSYRTKFPELEFENGAMIMGRVISKPGDNRLCLDLGYKSIAPDNPWPRIEFPEIPDAQLVNHSEEHLAIETSHAAKYSVGDVVFGIPFHVCPTVALHRDGMVVRNRRAVERWRVIARDRQITY
jgi:D-serine deaminase-like pyridoxal phosphate-dependent protein